MWFLPGNKKIFLDLFTRERGFLHQVVKVASTIPLEQEDELLFLWDKEPNKVSLPNVIIVRSGEARKFLAWATTVIGGYRPFTAFFKVLDRTEAEMVFQLADPKLDTLENPFVGLIIGEYLAQSGNFKSFSSLSVLPFESTYSFSFARAFALGYWEPKGKGDPIAAPWALARNLTRQPARRLRDESVRCALTLTAALATKDIKVSNTHVSEFVRLACFDLYSYGEVKNSWSALENQLPSLPIMVKEMKGTREQRVRTFEQFLRQPKNLDPITSSFLIGLFANQIGPGTLDHIELLGSYAAQDPMVLVWYGLCAGLSPDSDLQQAGNCLGRRLVRDLLTPDPLLSRPKYDIDIRELEVCLGRELPLEFRVASQGHIAVEILSGVPAFMKWPTKDPGLLIETQSSEVKRKESTSMSSQTDMFRSVENKVSWKEGQDAIRDLERATNRLKSIWVDLARGQDDFKPQGKNKRR